MSRRPQPPKHAVIAFAQRRVLSTLPAFAGENRRPSLTCWACGQTGGARPHRAHIVPHSTGGTNVPSNYLLLCERCHREQPDAQPRPMQLEWLRDHEPVAMRHARANEQMLAALQREAARHFPDLDDDGHRGIVIVWGMNRGDEHVRQVFHDGYQSAAGWENCEANATAAMVADLRSYVAELKP
jgi:hypothetical protein